MTSDSQLKIHDGNTDTRWERDYNNNYCISTHKLFPNSKTVIQNGEEGER